MIAHFFSYDIDQSNQRPRTVIDSDALIWHKIVRHVGRNYWIGEAYSETSLNKDLSEEDYKNGPALVEAKNQAVKQIKELQARYYLEIEGPNDINFKKARTKAYVQNDMVDFDILNFQKAQVRERGNEKEVEVLRATTLNELTEIDLAFVYDVKPELKFSAITVGSFLARLTAEENEDLNEFMKLNQIIQKEYLALLRRTHVNLKDQGLGVIIKMLEQGGVFQANPIDPTYPSRIAEILRQGDQWEAYRPSMP